MPAIFSILVCTKGGTVDMMEAHVCDVNSNTGEVEMRKLDKTREEYNGRFKEAVQSRCPDGEESKYISAAASAE
jgi:hypothetical protein